MKKVARRGKKRISVVKRGKQSIKKVDTKSQTSKRVSKKTVETFWNGVNSKITQSSDFEIPVEYPDSLLNIPPYKKLKQNRYRPPLCRPSFNEDDAFVCKCTIKTGGCDADCQNRLLYT
jgi:hypothetical protein